MAAGAGAKAKCVAWFAHVGREDEWALASSLKFSSVSWLLADWYFLGVVAGAPPAGAEDFAECGVGVWKSKKNE